MIVLHRFNSGSEFILNADLIKTVESTPDTLITLQTNEKLLVSERPEQIIAQVVEYARAIRQPHDYIADPLTRSG